MEKSRDYCHLYFGCWDEQNPPNYADYMGKIEFTDAWAVRSVDVEFYDIHPKEGYQFKSSIFIVENSVWLKEVLAIRNKYYSDNWTGWKDRTYKHYLVSSHDNYFEIIATDYRVERIDKTAAGKYAYLIKEKK